MIAVALIVPTALVLAALWIWARVAGWIIHRDDALIVKRILDHARKDEAR